MPSTYVHAQLAVLPPCRWYDDFEKYIKDNSAQNGIEEDVSSLYAAAPPGRIRNNDLIDTSDLAVDHLDDDDDFPQGADWKNHLKSTMCAFLSQACLRVVPVLMLQVARGEGVLSHLAVAHAAQKKSTLHCQRKHGTCS